MEDCFEERLCEEIRRHPHLYDSSLREHRDTLLILKTWRAISRALGRDENTCRYKWKYMRDKYVKAKRKMKEKPGEAAPFTPTIVSMLDWLSDFIRHRETESFPEESEASSEPVVLQVECISAGPAADQTSLCAAGSVTLAGPSLEPLPPSASPSSSSCGLRLSAAASPAAPTSSAPTSSVTPAKSRKRRERPTSLQDVILDRLKRLDRDRKEDSEEASFGRMVAGMLMKLPPQKRLDAKFEIHHMLYRMQKEFCQIQPNQ
ncbi:transcription factor Adf-1-like [Brachyistius frenatus]|uniref:transcription factor Adf-1-like n=1 Tax=Brachyistius frenatus TaxID=100188 RepID=UPI0037E84545